MHNYKILCFSNYDVIKITVYGNYGSNGECYERNGQNNGQRQKSDEYWAIYKLYEDLYYIKIENVDDERDDSRYNELIIRWNRW